MMFEMMKEMMGNDCGNVNPADMCQAMMRSVSDTAKMAGYATPEVHALFEEWSNQVENEILELLKSGFESTSKIAESMNVSEDSVLYFLSKLIRDKKIIITSLKVPSDVC